MARQPLNQRHTRKLYKTGNDATYAITIPIDMIRQFGWQERQKLTIRADEKNNRLIIEDWSE